MLDIAHIFSSRARAKVLRTLYYQEAPLPLRQVAYLAQMPLFSIQRVLKQMAEEKLVTRKKQKQYRLFSLNRTHAFYSFLAELFDLERRYDASFLSSRFDRKAKNLLDFVSATRDLFRNMKAA